jgi:8-oxo-dGTP pyrophosphatase MutT (NUDIX family)
MSASNKQAVSIIIYDEKKQNILLIKRRDIPVWVLPGGGIDEGESPETAAKREALEETGYQIELVRKIAEYQPVNKMTLLTHFFEGRVSLGKSSIGAETTEIQFFPLNTLPVLPPPYKGWIKDANHFHPYMLKKKIEGVTYWILLKLMIQHPILVARYLLTKIGIHWNK